ncbi:MAG: pre-60S ribosomal particles component [Sporothrix thermara]
MSGAVSRKRRGDDSLSASRPNKSNGGRIQKKRKRQQQPAYHSDSESMDDASGAGNLKDLEEDDEDDEFQAVDLLDSDDEALDQLADDGATSDEDDDEAGSNDDDDDDDDSEDDDDDLDSLGDAGNGSSDDEGGKDGKQKQASKQTKNKTKPSPKQSKKAVPAARDAPTDDEDGEDDHDDEDDNDSFAGSEDDGSDAGGSKIARGASNKSKRNDPATFATSLSKILGTKLSSSRRADPVLARSAEAHEASRRVVDAQLEEKARRQMRLEKRVALEKGRVKDVLVATNKAMVEGGDGGGDNDGDSNVAETTTTILATERRLRKVAQRGVVQLFNAVRAAQTKAAQAQKQAQSEGLLGMDKRSARVTEMSRKGFLDLIASGGGGLKKGGLEEA